MLQPENTPSGVYRLSHVSYTSSRLFGISIFSNSLQFANALSPNFTSSFGKFTSFKLLHPSNADIPISVTLSAIVTLDNDLQLLKALFPMLSTLSEIITSLTEVLLPKAPSPMAVTEFGISTIS